MPDVHALLSASSSKQWLHCPPSVRLQENFPNESSVYAAEGTYAHEVCEYKVRKYLKERVKRPQSEEYDTEEIEQITDVYAEFVISIIEQMKENTNASGPSEEIARLAGVRFVNISEPEKKITFNAALSSHNGNCINDSV